MPAAPEKKKAVSKKSQALAAQKKESPKKEKTAGKLLRLRNLGAGVLFLVIGGAMVLFSGYLLWQRVFAPIRLEKILPEKNLILFANMDSLQGIKTLQEKAPAVAQMVDYWQNWLFSNDLMAEKAWLGPRGGIAVYSQTEGAEENRIAMITFSEIKNRTELENDLKKRMGVNIAETSGYSLYSFAVPATRSCLIFENYLTCASNSSTLENFLNASKNHERTISEAPDFIAAAAELPRDFADRLFVRSTPFVESFGTFPALRVFLPFAKTLSSIGLTVTESDFSSTLSTSALFMRQEIGAEKDISNEVVDFSGDHPALLNFLPTNASSFVWGNDLTEDLLRGFQHLATIDPGYEKTLRTLLRDKTTALFGPDISWEGDILPLLEGEFAFGANTNGMYFLLETHDAAFASAKAVKLQAALQRMVQNFFPQILAHTLPNGNTLQEVFPNATPVTTEKTTQNGADIFTIETDSENGAPAFSLGFARQDSLLLLTTPKNALSPLLSGASKADILQSLPVRFAGASEDVFAFSPAFWKQSWIKNILGNADAVLALTKRISGKVVNTPQFFRLEGHAEF